MKRSVCPLTNCLDLIGDKWTLLIIRDLFFFKSREYGDLLTLSIGEKISTNILANRLSVLTESNLINKSKHPTNKTKYVYTLTDKGLALKPILKSFVTWGLKNIQGTRIHPDKKFQL